MELWQQLLLALKSRAPQKCSEIANKLDCSTNTARKRVSRVLGYNGYTVGDSIPSVKMLLEVMEAAGFELRIEDKRNVIATIRQVRKPKPPKPIKAKRTRRKARVRRKRRRKAPG